MWGFERNKNYVPNKYSVKPKEWLGKTTIHHGIITSIINCFKLQASYLLYICRSHKRANAETKFNKKITILPPLNTASQLPLNITTKNFPSQSARGG